VFDPFFSFLLAFFCNSCLTFFFPFVLEKIPLFSNSFRSLDRVDRLFRKVSLDSLSNDLDISFSLL
jgi:hypothetical protein